jgi:predicted transcriptional regulator
MRKHRTREEIIAEMLSIALTNAKQTHIMYQANLSYPLLQKYLQLLTDSDLIKHHHEDNTYTITPKGEHYLDLYTEYKTIQHMIETRELEYVQKKASLYQLLQ